MNGFVTKCERDFHVGIDFHVGMECNGEQGWCSSESACLAPMSSAFNSHM